MLRCCSLAVLLSCGDLMLLAAQHPTEALLRTADERNRNLRKVLDFQYYRVMALKPVTTDGRAGGRHVGRARSSINRHLQQSARRVPIFAWADRIRIAMSSRSSVWV